MLVLYVSLFILLRGGGEGEEQTNVNIYELLYNSRTYSLNYYAPEILMVSVRSTQ